MKLFELTQQVRSVDHWYTELCMAMRYGTLLADDICFLNGEDTLVPGSYLRSTRRALCGRGCERLIGSQPCSIRRMECAECRQYRCDRHVVREDKADPRYKEERFANARFLTYYNDIRFDVGLDRAYAQACSFDPPEHVTIVITDDKILYPNTYTEAQTYTLKEEWSRLDDSKCGGLPGQ